jgi:hypothetical protein
MIARLLNDFSGLFVAARPQERPTRTELMLLALIVAAGAVLRFWGLGSVGLHGDEETMAMPTMHIVEHGTPHLPSGMFYPRAIAQLYMMAGSVALFGESEWALRLPSALCGVLLIALAFFVGRRFLTPRWSLALAAAVAFLPEFIIDAQTARMYVFMVTSIAAFLILLFAWERTDRIGYLIGAVLALIVGLQFHTLVVFSSLLLFFPGLLHGDMRKFLFGAGAFAVSVLGFLVIDAWVASFYPTPPPLPGADIDALPDGPKAGEAIPQLGMVGLLIAAAVAALAAVFVTRGLPRAPRWICAALLAAALVAQAGFQYHAAFLLYAAAFVISERQGGVVRRRLLALGVAVAAMAVTQAFLLYSNGVDSPRRILGALLGWPSVWPLLTIGEYSVFAVLLVAAAVALALWRLSRGKAVPDHLLFVAIGVWVPLMLIGMFMWYIPVRYAAGQSLPLLVGAFASCQWMLGMLQSRIRSSAAGWQTAAAAALACVLVVNPAATASTVNSGYAIHPDHKGAALFLQSRLGPDDIVIAEDVLQQTYYLGSVDYWLIGRHMAAPFVHEVNGEIREFYTNSPLISTAEELQSVLARTNRGSVYIVGSGENQEDGRRYMRGRELADVLESMPLEVVYEGRDGLTKVWRVPQHVLAAARE